METKNQIVKKQSETPMFYDDAMATLDKALEWAQLMLNSKMLPKHFYETKLENGKNVTDYTKGNPGAVLMVIQHGKALGLSTSQAIQQVVPVNNVMSVKGDGCKALILGSGKCAEWTEKITGSIDAGDYKVEIYSKRRDNGEERTDYFDLKKAKRAGLYHSDSELAKLKDNQQYAYKFTGWYKYPERMVRYRVLGFIARDLYADVMGGTVTYEEAIDYPEETKIEVIQQEGRQPLMVDHGKIDHLTEKVNKASEKMVSKKDTTFKKQNIQDVEEIPEGKQTNEQQDPDPQTDQPPVQEELKENKDFDSGKEFVIPEVPASKKRVLLDKKAVYKYLTGLGASQENFVESTKGTILYDKYPTLEEFCSVAPVSEINILVKKLKN